MTSTSQFTPLYAWHFRTTRLLIDRAAALAEADYRANPGHGHGSIHDTLFHLLRTDMSWRAALETGEQKAGASPADYPTLEALRAGFEAEERAWAAYLAGVTDASARDEVSLKNWRGEPFTMALWRILQHIVLHGMQHHGELAQTLTALGQSPGNIDFLFFRESASPAQ